MSEVKADLGDRVKKGDLLAVLSVPELDKSLAQAKATLAARKQMLRAAEAAVAQSRQALEVSRRQLDSYRAEMQYQQATLKRQAELSEGHAATPQQLDEAKSKAAVAEATAGMGEAKLASAEADIQSAQANRDLAAAQIDVADAQVQEAEALLEYTRITAPFDGAVTRRLVDLGDLVQAAAAGRAGPLFTVQQTDTVRVFCDVPELKAAGVSVGARAEVKLYGLDGKAVEGAVTRVAGSLDPATRTMRVEIDLKNPDDALRPGMYAQVTLTLRPPARAGGVNDAAGAVPGR